MQVGPFAIGTGSNWYGPYGEPLNALGYKTVLTSASTTSYAFTPDPDLPNPVTVNAGGMLAIAVDQANASQFRNTTSDIPANPTPDYLRNPVTLNGGSISATGFEVDFPTTGLQGAVPNTTPVTARLGGNFTVASGTSTILAYDAIGNTGSRSVQLVGGSRFLLTPTAAFPNPNGTMLTYNTTWNGVLNVDGGGYGGEFDLLRDSSGTVSVGSGAAINVFNGANRQRGRHGSELGAHRRGCGTQRRAL